MNKKNKLFVLALIVACSVKAQAAIYTISPSTPAATSVTLVTGSGLLNGIEKSTGAAGDFCVAFDSAAAVVAGNNDSATAKRLGIVVNAATNTSNSFAANRSRPFVNGVTVICNAITSAIIDITQ